MMRAKCLLPALFFLLTASAAGQDYTSSSVLSSGRWVKIGVTGPGVCRIDYSQIRDMGFDDPSAVVIYGNNRGQLSFYNDGTAPDDLKKIAFLPDKGSDGVFGQGDYILFYAEGTHRWNYDGQSGEYAFLRHHYSDTAWYFITARPGSATIIATEIPPASQPAYISSSYDLNLRHEKEEVNLIRSGREWYQQVVPGTVTPVCPPLPALVNGSKIHYTVRVLARSSVSTSFILRQGSTVVREIRLSPVSVNDINGIYADIAVAADSVMPLSQSPAFTVEYRNGGDLAATGYVDFADYRARAQLTCNDRQVIFADLQSVKPGMITKFEVSSSGSPSVWDVTDPFTPKVMNTVSAGGSVSFAAATDSLRRFVAFTPQQVIRPVIRTVTVPNQDLHALAPADMIIVTHPLFRPWAEKIAALHLADDGLSSVIVTPEQIYNEFSGGVPDAAAIRNFVRMMYLKGKDRTSTPGYLLLFGDGSYENKTPPPGNTSFIPTWQSVNSHVGVLSFTSDDFYGLLDEGEGEADGTLDISIGRLPAGDTVSARVIAGKIGDYMSVETMGPWRNNICIVADDEDTNLHMTDAESLAAKAQSEAPPLTIDKIYLDVYRQVSGVSGDSYPDAEKALNDRIAAGCLLVNYVGHGNESGLAHERVVRTDDINSWKNKTMLPLFITATCEFSRFDDVAVDPATGKIDARTSAGEMVLLNPSGGGIALMSTTRVVYSAPNFALNYCIYDYAFMADASGKAARMGDIIRQAKACSGQGMNKRNFLLLGDPALRLAYPVGGKVVADSINGVSITGAADTLKALSVVRLAGHVEDDCGNLLTGFSGKVSAVIYDKSHTVTTLANDGGDPMKFGVTGSTVFRGTAAVTEGRFSFTFMVPLDIDYTFGKGKLTFYAYCDTADMNGSSGEITVGGYDGEGADDNEGPEIRLFMNDTLFADGGVTDNSPSLLALLADNSGINATGAGIGHDIIVWIDDDMNGSVVLNGLYTADSGTHTSGSLIYPLDITEKGEHKISLRAWDNLNNPSVAELHFIVGSDGAFRLTDLLSFPNPADDEAWFTAGHNRPDSEIDVTITVFRTDGTPVRTIREHVFSTGYQLPDIRWDGCNDNGSRVSRGLYIWRAEARTSSGERAQASGRIIIL